jgi:hypothetical protein
MIQSFNRFFIAVVLILFVSVSAYAESFSYVYIQGDKNTPFYVKFEGEMLPRFGKNYYIISELAPGPISVEILFQQNAYPSQKFTIQVPEGSFRGFLLMQKDGGFALYDIHRQFYLPANNKIEDDHIELPAAPAYANNNFSPVVPTRIATEPAVKEEVITSAPKPAVAKPKPAPTIVKVKKPVTKPVSNIVVAESGPAFIGDMELGNSKIKDDNMLPAGGKGVVRNKLAVINSDCPTAMSNNQFDALLKRVNSKTASERLKVIFDKMDNCFTSNQIRILAKTLSGDDQRFTLLKKAYPKVTDQSTFETLENLLSGDEWKGYFRDMVHK